MGISDRLTAAILDADRAHDDAAGMLRRLTARRTPSDELAGALNELDHLREYPNDAAALEGAAARVREIIARAKRPASPRTDSAPEESAAPASLPHAEAQVAAAPPVADPMPAPGVDSQDSVRSAEPGGATARAPIDYALAYVALGWPVLPVGADKTPLGGKGIKHATTNEATIRRWWTRWPDAGVGIHLEAAGLCAIDIDPRNGATKTPADFPATLTARTGGGGWHLIYRAPEGLALPGKLEAGVDIKHRGYVIVEPSAHPSGGRYSWEGFDPIEHAIVGAPDIAPFPVALLPSERQAAPDLAPSAPDLDSAVALAAFTDETRAELRSALAAIPSDDRDDWVRLGQALKHLGDAGLELWLEWSRKSAKFDADDAARVWESLTGERTDYRAVFAEAQRRGWVNPKSAAAEKEMLHAESAAGGRRFEAFPAAQFVARGAFADWIVKGVLPHAEILLIVGESGAGKSFFTLDIGAHVALGLPWRGRRAKRLRVVYVCAEGAAGFRNRLAAWCQHHDVALEQLDLIVIPAAPNLLQKEEVRELLAELQRHAPVGLIVIDTFAQTTAGGDENSGQDMGRALGHCKALHKATGATIGLVHHLGKDASRGARGWSGIKAAADAEITVERRTSMNRATVTKLKDGAEGAVFDFKLVEVDLGHDSDGEPINSCVLHFSEAAHESRAKRVPTGEVEKLTWTVMHELVELGDGPLTTQQVIATASGRLTPPPEGKQDRRVFRVQRAIDGLREKGFIFQDAGIIDIREGR